MSREHTGLELEVLAGVAQEEHELELLAAAELLEAGGYDRARGMYPGEHWRRAVGTGCLHMRIRGDRAWLHWDRWDPRRYPLRHVVETPELALPSAGAVTLALVAGVRRTLI